VSTTAELSLALEEAGIGKQVALTVERDGRRRNVDVTVQDIN
jgi:S1-C subfamily serine protease